MYFQTLRLCMSLTLCGLIACQSSDSTSGLEPTSSEFDGSTIGTDVSEQEDAAALRDGGTADAGVKKNACAAARPQWNSP